jgi:hypothetical protein
MKDVNCRSSVKDDGSGGSGHQCFGQRQQFGLLAASGLLVRAVKMRPAGADGNAKRQGCCFEIAIIPKRKHE